MPQQLITGTDCCPCNCPLTVNLTQNITNVTTGAAAIISDANPTVTGTEVQGLEWFNRKTGAFFYFDNGAWTEEIA